MRIKKFSEFKKRKKTKIRKVEGEYNWVSNYNHFSPMQNPNNFIIKKVSL
jgi:hypothetical protein